MKKRAMFAAFIIWMFLLPLASADTVFKSSFESPVVMSDWIRSTNWRKETTGADQGYDWETDIVSTTSFWNIILNSATYPNPGECIELDITTNEAYSGTRSLYMKVIKQCKYNSVQARVSHAIGEHWPYDETHIKYWLKFPSDIEARFQGGGAVLNEIRLPGDLRIAFDVTTANGPLQFRAWADDISSGWNPHWVVTSDEPVPVNEWFRVEIYTNWKTYAEGGGAYWIKINGNKVIEVIPTATKRICGASVTSQICDNPYNWNMIKLYTYHNNIEAWLDDFEVYDTFTPEDAPQTYECNDGTDNDGDDLTDLSDPGCSSLTDNDETNCGDSRCEGGETPENCCLDCGTCQTLLPNVPAEAEAGVLSLPMQTGSDPLASGGSCIHTVINHQGSASYTFDITSLGDYMMEARVIAPDVGNNSFYVGLDNQQVQGDDAYTWDIIETGTWTRVNVSLRGLGGNDTYAEFDPMVWTLSSGSHTFTIFGRETGALLDQLILRPLSQKSAPSEYNYSILKTPNPPAIDGDLTEFSGAPSITITEPTQGAKGTYRLLWDNQALYIAASFQDPQLNAQHTENETKLWQDDSLEIMFDTLHDSGSVIRQDDYKFFVNVLEARMDSRSYNSSWNTTFTYAVIPTGTVNDNSGTDTGYDLEMAIPWQDWGITPPGFGSPWGMNIVLNDLAASGKYSTIWSDPDPSKVNIPDFWNDVLFTVCADTSQDGCIDSQELISFIDLWKYDSTSYPMMELMEAVVLYYNP